MALQNERKRKEFWLIILFVLSFLALIDGIFLTYEHYSANGSSLCNFGTALNCDAVNKSPYSTVDNIFYFLAVDLGLSVPIIAISIPIAVMVILVFLLVKLHILHIWHEKSIWKYSPNHMIWGIRGILIFSMLYGLWLIYIQKTILQTFCVYCLILDVLIFSSLIVSFMIKTEWKKYEIRVRK